ncbi:putative amidophosphoribosyltransferase [Fructilactobacillus florum 2F]|nr:putative amidophosphoribosyltransferase [Fructilactobacillus florum 2F]
MNKLQCLWCQRSLNYDFSVHFLVSFSSVAPTRLCAGCLDQFTPVAAPHCPKCGKFQATTQQCSDCRHWNDRMKASLISNRAFFPYKDQIKEYIKQYKLRGDYRLRLIMEPLFSNLARTNEMLVPIPVTATTIEQRGFNQVSGWFGSNQLFPALLALPKDRPQAAKGRHDRLSGPQRFVVNEKLRSACLNRDICLVDDIYTTGRTLHEAAWLLQSAGARHIRSVTLAH